jgi:hypothetical protein
MTFLSVSIQVKNKKPKNAIQAGIELSTSQIYAKLSSTPLELLKGLFGRSTVSVEKKIQLVQLEKFQCNLRRPSSLDYSCA